MSTVARGLIEEFPVVYHPEISGALGRAQFQLSLITDRIGKDLDICDVGGGNGLFAVAASRVGMRVTLIDDYGDNGTDHSSLWRVIEKAGVRLLRMDAMTNPLPFAPNSLDAVTLFDVLEHLHASPKRLLHSLKNALRPNGLMVIGVPNAVNLRKRISVLCGRTNWSQMSEWYDKPVFRSHVREPVVDDLRYMARDLGLRNCQVLGRNFAGQISERRVTRILAAMTDRLLRLRPSLCSDLYLIGQT